MTGTDPTGKRLSLVWESGDRCAAEPTFHVRMLCGAMSLLVCPHTHAGTTTLICMDVTTLDTMLDQHALSLVVRLTTYGTIDSCLSRYPLALDSIIGIPIMRLVHTDDAGRLCAGLKRASNGHTTTLDLLYQDPRDHQSLEITASISSGDLLCCISAPHLFGNVTRPPILLGHTFQVPFNPVKGIIQRSRERVLRLVLTVIITLQHMKSRPLISQFWECVVWTGLIDSLLWDTLLEGRPSTAIL
ncbi:hypothetical protein CLU79DRAFT_834675 [Phycomyces nitens]|nr:hypothetical protein CLU79DRAFT_834675 [Phycomyces nitens]